MSLSGSAKLVSKMGFLQSLTVVLILINSLKARTLLGPLTNLKDISKNDSDGASDEANDVSLKEPYVSEESVEDIQSGLFPVKLERPSENNIHLIAHTQQDGNAIHFLPTQQNDPKILEKTIEQAEFEQGKSPERLLSPILIREDSPDQVFALKQDVYSSMKEVQPLLVQETLPSLSKEVESKHLKGIAPEYNQDSFQPLPAIKQEIESLQLSDCIKKLQSFFPNTLTNLGDVLSTHEHDTLPPLPNPMGDIKTEQLETFEKGNLGELHEPLPPTLTQVKLPDQSLMPIKDSPTIPPVPNPDHVLSSQTSDGKVLAEAPLPITEEHFPAPVVPSGPYPAEVSILKEIPVAHVAEPLPPLRNGVFTAKYPTSLEHKVQLPMGSPYITAS
ncbi:uncharacterized protein LOC123311754 [Coccinella septempunctata]|uniref:uncharacterized protein LOC123311754 n=1 Tax=Coccinella septempunctata TaxID=41139 RepID=UPI001D06E0C3|nr:uncharacterized protein LOC123311754 [Coccinella septempunctata]